MLKFYLFCIFFLVGCQSNINNNFSNELDTLRILPILEDLSDVENFSKFELSVNMGEMNFFDGILTDTYGYNGNFLGPVIKVSDGDNVSILVKNNLNEVTTVHWHGLKVDGKNDGGPHNIINSNGGVWNANFIVNQSASTLWFHPHPHPHTGKQVFMGLAGLFIIEDNISDNLNIPREYGVNDIALIISDKRFDGNGQLRYVENHHDIINGVTGENILVNGGIFPNKNVYSELIRLRIVNGATSRVFDYSFSNYLDFYQIAGDGGFLEKPLKMKNLILAPGERAEILIDLSNYDVGENIFLKYSDFEILKLSVIGDDSGFISSGLSFSDVDEFFLEYDSVVINDSLKKRFFEMSMVGPVGLINGVSMDMDVINEYVNLGDLEVWEVENIGMHHGGFGGMGQGMRNMGGMMNTAHSFHIHGVQFKVLERNGDEPFENEKGWKDTVKVEVGEKVKLLIRFEYSGLFMYHCHFLEHEDAGMMGQFLVE